MSVINKMLQEIEERHDETAQKAMPGVVRAVPGAGERWNAKRWALIAGLLAASGAVGFIYWQTVSVKKSQPVIVPKVSPPAAPSPIAPASPPAEVAKPEASTPVAEAPQLQTSTSLSVAPAMPEPGERRPAPPAVPIKPLMRARDPAPQAPPVETANPEKPAPLKADARQIAGMKQMSPAQRLDYRYREGLSLLSQGRQSDAQAAFEEVLKLDAHHLGARQVLLAIHIEAKRYAAAEQLLREGLQLGIAPAAYAMTLARLQVEQGDQAGALTTLEQHAAQSANDAEYAGFYAALLQRANRHAEAIAQFQTALKLRPNQASWWLALGVSLQASQRHAEAEQAYQRALDSHSLTPALQSLAEQRLKQVREPH